MFIKVHTNCSLRIVGLFFILTAALLIGSFPIIAAGGADNSENKSPGKKDGKDQSESPTKQEREYQKIKAYGLDLYSKDADFRSEVDESLRLKQREHSEYAFRINTMDRSYEHFTRTGDRLAVENSLYDNPLVQDYVNRVGQSIVPKNSTHLFGFKVILNPIPESRSLSTGTVYISSGLLSMVDNEAQLAYVLGHEIAHIEQNHWKEDVLVDLAKDRYNESQKKKRSIFTNIASVGVGMVTGGLSNSFGNAALVSMYSQLALPSIIKLAVPDAVFTWDKQQEDEADRMAMKYMLDRNYDPREVPKLYANLQHASQSDSRAGLGFLANAARISERVKSVSDLIGGLGSGLQTNLYVGAVNLTAQQQAKAAATQQEAIITAAQQKPPTPDAGKSFDPSKDASDRLAKAEQALVGPLKADIQARLDAGQLIGSSAEFQAVMAELKRDNGIRAYYYDMFQMARDDLEESLLIRSDDPYTHFYYGKLLKLTARNATDKSLALAELVKAIDLDKRHVLPEPHLHRALALMDRRDPAQTPEVISSLQEYVAIYQREHGGVLPPNMEVIYDYMQEAGELAWAATPATNISTKGIEPINTLLHEEPKIVETQDREPKIEEKPHPKSTPAKRPPAKRNR